MKFERWYDVNGCGEITIAVANISTKRKADNVENKLNHALNLMKAVEKEYKMANKFINIAHENGDKKDEKYFIELWHQMGALLVSSKPRSIGDE